MERDRIQYNGFLYKNRGRLDKEIATLFAKLIYKSVRKNKIFYY